MSFWAPFGGLGSTYDDHLRLTGKRVVDFLLVLIELISLGVTAEALRANIGWKSAKILRHPLLHGRFKNLPTFHPETIGPDGGRCSVETPMMTFKYFSRLVRGILLFVIAVQIQGEPENWTIFKSLQLLHMIT